MNDRDIVRDLARRVAAYAAEPANARIVKRWQDVNGLRKPDRPPVWCRPVGAWDEILPDSALRCSDPGLRGVEKGLRRILIKREMGDDTPINDWYDVPIKLDVDPPNTWGVDIGHHMPSEKGGAWLFDPPLKQAEDLDKLRLPTYRLDRAGTDRALAQAGELLGDILPPRLYGGPPIGATLCSYAAELRGLTPMLMDMMDSPELVHRLMAYLRDACLRGMDQVEATGLMSTNRFDPMTGSDPVGKARADGTLGFENLWCMGNSQEFDPVSPDMWKEFLLEYQKPIFARFGLVAYGCCENLTNKMEGVLAIPNLRIFVCSAWTDLGKLVERVGDKHVIMWRQKATDVVHAPDEAALRKALREGLKRLRGCRVQIVLRELQTLNGRPDRLHVWSRVAIEEAERFAREN